MDTSASPGPSSASTATATVASSSPEPQQWACELACKVLCAAVTCAFAAVGSVVGAVAGSVIGLATESGVVRGAGIGAISGAVFSIEVAESSRDLWHTSDSAVWSVLYMVTSPSMAYAKPTFLTTSADLTIGTRRRLGSMLNYISTVPFRWKAICMLQLLPPSEGMHDYLSFALCVAVLEQMSIGETTHCN